MAKLSQNRKAAERVADLEAEVIRLRAELRKAKATRKTEQ
ncbi:hypothetical protein GA0070619_0619 [Micromonospora zamorensis]|nr:hypothetical protein GA0070619_0619 [Micromonospora zamorensis]